MSEEKREHVREFFDFLLKGVNEATEEDVPEIKSKILNVLRERFDRAWMVSGAWQDIMNREKKEHWSPDIWCIELAKWRFQLALKQAMVSGLMVQCINQNRA